MVAVLVERGEISWDTRVADAFEEEDLAANGTVPTTLCPAQRKPCAMTSERSYWMVNLSLACVTGCAGMFLLDGEINTVRFLCHQQIIRLYIGANVQMGLTATISDLLHHRAGLPADLDDEEEAALLQKTADWSAPAARWPGR